jgi:hypothetical protein
MLTTNAALLINGSNQRLKPTPRSQSRNDRKNRLIKTKSLEKSNNGIYERAKEK